MTTPLYIIAEAHNACDTALLSIGFAQVGVIPAYMWDYGKIFGDFVGDLERDFVAVDKLICHRLSDSHTICSRSISTIA